MSNLDKVRDIINHFQVCQEHNTFIIHKLKELEQGIINELDVKL